jgi:hypothetical protein
MLPVEANSEEPTLPRVDQIEDKHVWMVNNKENQTNWLS